ncbi:double-CXXCG motif protein [Massilia sp. PAMC28688]|uniref:double-CXXCG motif protein n=1 Tax=Massilia sp. PAMC28688 TaxID=2861283 RepID=UPI001C634DFE|nr:double-CXXCG motif protein [Massilia sp. PAMC28688]QYF94897.1 double-CXXCG motif protein [Massilia sp. PAMC28688]
MNYFVMRRVSDPRVLGVNNGICQAHIQEDGFHCKDEYTKVMRFLGSNEFWGHRGQIPTMEFDLQCVRLIPKAKLTDFLQYGPVLMLCPFLVSGRVKDLLNQFNAYGTRYWPARVEDSKTAHEYYLSFIENIPDDMIDFTRSTFSVGGPVLKKTTHTFADAAEKKEFMKTHRLVDFEEIYLNGTFPADTDFFRFSNATIMVSERLKLAIEDLKLTGARILPANGTWEKVYAVRRNLLRDEFVPRVEKY